MDIEIKFFSKKIQIYVFHLLPRQMRLCSRCEMHSLCTFKSRRKKFSHLAQETYCLLCLLINTEGLILTLCMYHAEGFPGCSVVNNSPATGNTDWIPALGRLPGEENGIPLQYSSSCLGNAMDRGAWWATIHGVTKESDLTDWLNNTIYHAEHKQSLFQEHAMAI